MGGQAEIAEPHDGGLHPRAAPPDRPPPVPQPEPEVAGGRRARRRERGRRLWGAAEATLASLLMITVHLPLRLERRSLEGTFESTEALMSISNRSPGAQGGPERAAQAAIAGCLRALRASPSSRWSTRPTGRSSRPARRACRSRPASSRPRTSRSCAAMRIRCRSGSPATMRRVHRRLAPQGQAARAMFDAVEQARVEAIGARRMAGVADNLSAMIEDRYHRGGKYEEITDRADAPIEDAVALMVRERLTGLKPPEAAEDRRAVARPHRGARPGAISTACSTISRTSATSPAPCASSCPRSTWRTRARSIGTRRTRTRTARPRARSRAARARRRSSARASAPRWTCRTTRPTSSRRARPRRPTRPSGELPDEAEDAEAEEASDAWRPPPARRNEPRGPEYKAFSTKFDEEIEAEELCDADELARLRAYLDKQLSHLQGVVGRLANRLQRRLLAQQNRSWEFDLEEGILDPARLVRVVIDPHQPLSFKQEKDTRIPRHRRDAPHRQFRLDARAGRSRSRRPAPTSWPGRWSAAA